MRAQSKPVQPAGLGVIGRDHIAAKFAALDVEMDSFQYKKTAALTSTGLPQVTEVAFAAHDDVDAGRRFVCGINWSAAWVNPFRRLGAYGRSLDSWLAERWAESDEPIVLLVHVAHPRVEYTDRGKSTVKTELQSDGC